MVRRCAFAGVMCCTRSPGRRGRNASPWNGGATSRATYLTRDYFRVESRQGARAWLYREGLYGRETAQPRWFLHGLFA